MQKKILFGFAFVFMVFGILLVININIKNDNKKSVHKKELIKDWLDIQKREFKWISTK